MLTRDTDYERDCPRCGSDTTVKSDGRYRVCDDPECPWEVTKRGRGL